MRKYIISTFLSLVSTLAIAQLQNVDSLHQQLKKEKTDTGVYMIYRKLAGHYNSSNGDSAIVYSKLTAQAAKKLNIPLLDAFAEGWLGFSYCIAGDYTHAQKAILNGFSITDGIDASNTLLPAGFFRFIGLRDSVKSATWAKTAIVAELHYVQGFIYHKIEAKKKAEQEHLISKKLLEQIDFKFFLPLTLSNLAYESALIGKYDQGVQYGLQAYQLDRELKLKDWDPWILCYIGYNYLGLHRISEARGYFYRAVADAKASKIIGDRPRILAYSFLAESFLITKQTDSALHYAHAGLNIANRQAFKSYVVPLDTLLSAVHFSRGQTDSAYFYLKIANNLKDQLYSGQKAQELQGIVEADKERKGQLLASQRVYKNKLQLYGFAGGLLFLLIVAFILLRSNRVKQRAFNLLKKQKEETDYQRVQTERVLENLKATQTQLIQSEKMASLGELTAGIAHEIQNPLNFVNNFSEVNSELIDEMQQEIEKGDLKEVKAIAGDIKENQQKINHHGKRAEAIVKGMLQHSRASTGKKELTDINALADEYLRLSYHGLRAKDKEFSATIKTDFDQSIGKIEVVPQDMGRVLLNLYNNAFYAVNEKRKQSGQSYEPIVSVSTKKERDRVVIIVKDNGNGMPQNVVDKIFQPFFTTKPTGEGTGLGLSLSFDILKAHGGELKVETKEGEGSTFIILILLNS